MTFLINVRHQYPSNSDWCILATTSLTYQNLVLH